MALYSLQGALPAPLPARIRLADGRTRTKPSTYSTEEIQDWGYIGPIELPIYEWASEVVEWSADDLAYVVRPLSEEELEERRLRDARQRVDYQGFYDALLISPTYQAIRGQAQENLALTVACTEFVAAITDAKFGRPNEAAIQACINNILSLVVFDEAELAGLVELMVDFSLDGLYSVPAT